MNRRTALFFVAILLLGFVARLYKFNNPIADWHSWRQVDTSAVSRDFVNNGFDVLHPTFEDLSNVPSGMENPKGYRFVEFPIYNIFQAGSYELFHFFTLEEWGRIVTIFSSLLSLTFIFLLLKKYTDDTVALFASFLYAVLPYNMYYGRVILPDPMMVMAIMGGIYFFDLWINNGEKQSNIKSLLFCILALIFTAASFLLKPFAIFFTFPMIAIAYSSYGISMVKKWQLWFFALLALIPLILWRVWMIQYPEGIPGSAWLLNGGNIRFKGAFFYWIFANRIGGLILGFWGASFLIIGLLLNSKSEKSYNFLKGQMLLFWSFLASSLTYLTVVARGNVQHDYYQILIIPTLVMFAGLGVKLFLNPPKELINRKFSISFFLICLVFALAFRWYVIRAYFNINKPSIIVAGEAVDRLVPKDAKVIANYEGDTTFLYYTNRKGWASYEKEMPEMIKIGADYLAIADPTLTDLNFAKTYRVVASTPQYLILDLHQSP